MDRSGRLVSVRQGGSHHACHQRTHRVHGRSARRTRKSLPSTGRSQCEHSRASFLPDRRQAKSALDSERLMCAETEVVQVKLPHKPGEIARIASRLGEAKINVDYAYCGCEPNTNAPLVFFGVAVVSKAAPILEQAAAAAAKP